MRVVGGSLRGRRLLAPPGKGTRPTVERVREAIFNILGGSVQGVRVLDLYAGSGSFGIEAVSRGAAHTVFVEAGRPAAQTIQQNLTSFGADYVTRFTLLQKPIEQAVARIVSLGPFDLCFVDPPFAMVRDGTALRTIEKVVAAGALSARALLILESPSDAPTSALAGLALDSSRAYGDTHLSFFRLESPSSHED